MRVVSQPFCQSTVAESLSWPLLLGEIPPAIRHARFDAHTIPSTQFIRLNRHRERLPSTALIAPLSVLFQAPPAQNTIYSKTLDHCELGTGSSSRHANSPSPRLPPAPRASAGARPGQGQFLRSRKDGVVLERQPSSHRPMVGWGGVAFLGSRPLFAGSSGHLLQEQLSGRG